MVLRKKKKKISFNENIFLVLQHRLNLPLKSIKSSIDGFIDDIFDNELLFFKWEIDILETKKFIIKQYDDLSKIDSDEEVEDSIFSYMSFYLSEIELLEYVYLLKTETKYYLFFVVKSLLGYNKTLLTRYISLLNNDECSLYLSNSIISYVSSRKIAKQYFYLMISQYTNYDLFVKNSFNFRACYTKQAIGYSYTKYIGATLGLAACQLDGLYKDFNILPNSSNGHVFINTFEILEKKAIYNVNPHSYDTEFLMLLEYDVFTLENDFKLISTKNVCEQSIINLWVMYMKFNGFYIKDGQIYEKFYSEKDSKFVGNLDYLKINMDIIIYFLKDKYRQQLPGYPIELKVMPYLESAYSRVVSSPHYYLPDDYDLENFYKIYKSDTDLLSSIKDYSINRLTLESYYRKLCYLDDQLILVK